MAQATGSRNRTLVLVAMPLANAMVLIDQTAAPLALPDIGNDLHPGSHLVQWVLNASLLPLAGLTILGGRLGDLLGRADLPARIGARAGRPRGHGDAGPQARRGRDDRGVSELASSPSNAAAQRTRLTSVSEEVA